jgi:hypothetical protein
MERILQSMLVKSGSRETIGNYQLEFHTKKDAIRKGIKAFALTFVAAAASSVLPGIHFVSVPIGLLAAPFVGLHFYSSRKGMPKSMTADFVCPECQAKNHVAAPRVTAFYDCKCVRCQTDLHLTPVQ